MMQNQFLLNAQSVLNSKSHNMSQESRDAWMALGIYEPELDEEISRDNFSNSYFACDYPCEISNFSNMNNIQLIKNEHQDHSSLSCNLHSSIIKRESIVDTESDLFDCLNSVNESDDFNGLNPIEKANYNFANEINSGLHSTRVSSSNSTGNRLLIKLEPNHNTMNSCGGSFSSDGSEEFEDLELNGLPFVSDEDSVNSGPFFSNFHSSIIGNTNGCYYDFPSNKEAKKKTNVIYVQSLKPRISPYCVKSRKPLRLKSLNSLQVQHRKSVHPMRPDSSSSTNFLPISNELASQQDPINVPPINDSTKNVFLIPIKNRSFKVQPKFIKFSTNSNTNCTNFSGKFNFASNIPVSLTDKRYMNNINNSNSIQFNSDTNNNNNKSKHNSDNNNDQFKSINDNSFYSPNINLGSLKNISISNRQNTSNAIYSSAGMNMGLCSQSSSLKKSVTSTVTSANGGRGLILKQEHCSNRVCLSGTGSSATSVKLAESLAQSTATNQQSNLQILDEYGQVLLRNFNANLTGQAGSTTSSASNSYSPSRSVGQASYIGSTFGNSTLQHHQHAPTVNGESRLRLLEYVVHLLSKSDSSVRWLQKDKRIFQIVDPTRLSHLWGCYKRSTPLTFNSVCRSLRLYYKDGTIKRLENKQNTYQILKEA